MALLSTIDGLIGKLDEWYFRFRWHRNRQEPLMFHQGWGSEGALDAVHAQWGSTAPPASIEIGWEQDWVAEQGVWIRRGSFATPAYAEHLPAESGMAFVHFVRPTLDETGPVVLLMPTSREAGVRLRMPAALALARHGISSLLLESPYMGRRKSPDQYQGVLSFFSDFLVLCAASIEEGRSLLGWLDRQGFDQLCVAGISQGGYLSSVTGLRAPVSTHIVAMLPPHSGVAVLVDGLLGRLCDWERLQQTCSLDSPVRQQMIELFAQTSLERLPPPAPHQRLTLVAARQDRYVPSTSYALLEQHWQQNADVRWLSGGHVSSIVERRHFIDAIVDTLSPALPSPLLTAS
ncbi:MAG TPA: alpha/beta hydrolase family protein [Burkholderiaceae bacterium]|nr:alpha/beta hydrolase family protein [Burkholderiaceae bacterium]